MSVNRFHSFKYNKNQQINLRNHSYLNITILFSLNLLKKLKENFFLFISFFSVAKEQTSTCIRIAIAVAWFLKTSLKARVNKMWKILKKGGTYNNINVKCTICYVKYWIMHSNLNSCNCKHFFHFFNNYNIVSCHYEILLLCFILTFQWKVKTNPSEPQTI